MSDDEYTNAEIARSLTRLEASQRETNSKLDALAAGFMPRGEFDAWRTGMDREIKALKDSRAPWWSVAAIVVSIGAVLLPLLTNR